MTQKNDRNETNCVKNSENDFWHKRCYILKLNQIY